MKTDFLHWHSFYIFFDSDRDSFLCRALKPFIGDLYSKNLIQKFFFIRYNENGSHVRLRLLSERTRKRLFSDLLENSCSGYFSGSYKIESTYYIPEYERYGRLEGLSLCESHFDLSSKTALEIIGPNYENILSKALILHFVMLLASPLKISESRSLLDRYCQNWLPHTGLITHEKQGFETTCEHFENRYQEFKQPEFFKQLFLLVKAGEKTGIAWLDKWISGNHAILPSLQKNISDADYYKDILGSLIHMTNNRTGIKNFDESYLAWFLKRTIEDEFETSP